MCGLYTLRTFYTVPFQRVVRVASETRYKVYPGEQAFIIRHGESGPEAVEARWGFRPSWAKRSRTPINARAETVASSRMFAGSLRQRRCLVPADGFYEPNRAVQHKAYVWFHRPDDEPFFFAGIWTRFAGEGEEPYENFAILTTEANDLIGAYHPRMPVLLEETERVAWLDPESRDTAFLEKMLHPAQRGLLEARHVPDNLYRLREDDPRCIEASGE
jgi:putative SOS response-associated peptidase YedK